MANSLKVDQAATEYFSQSSGSVGPFKEDLDPVTSGHTGLLNLAQVSCGLATTENYLLYKMPLLLFSSLDRKFHIQS